MVGAGSRGFPRLAAVFPPSNSLAPCRRPSPRMKTTRLILALLGAGLGTLPAQNAPAPVFGSNVTLVGSNATLAAPAPTAYQVTEQGANHRVWQRTTYEKAPDGTLVPHLHKYTELAAGLNYTNASGQLVPAQEVIEAFSGGAIARQGQFQVIFADNIHSAGAIDLQTPDGKRLRSNILGLAYVDESSGQTVTLAQIQDSTGELISSNQVLYPNAFSGVKADVRYTYKKGRFEQDVVLREQLITPESFGLNSDTTELEVLTEFINPPQETIRVHQRPDAETDQDISWGAMQIGHGRAFDLGAKQDSHSQVSVNKEYATVNGRKILLEKVKLKDIAPDLNKLPLQSSRNIKGPKLASKTLVLPPTPLAQAVGKPMTVAMTTPSNKGYVLDYVELDGSESGGSGDIGDFVFQRDTTYFISGWIFPGNVTIEDGAVLKYGPDGWLYPGGTITCNTDPYHPATFTTMDDNSVGEIIAGSSGSPSSDGPEYMYYDVNITGVMPLKNLRVCYGSGPAFFIDGSSDLAVEISDCQFSHCYMAVQRDYPLVTLRNVLFDQCSVGIALGDAYILTAEQVTANLGTLSSGGMTPPARST
jgi:hypothetical protein